MKISEKIPGIIHVEMNNQKELAETFLRFQEHYESPHFRGKVFTLGQFRAWYAQKMNGFTYHDDWNGFNVPSSSLRPFRTGLFDPLSDQEKKLLELIPDRLENYYVIGTHSEDSAVEHEVCHGLYFIDEKYRDEVNRLFARVKPGLLKPLEKFLLKIGYCEEVLVDEFNAYICEDTEYLDSKKVTYPNITNDLKKLKKAALRRRSKK